MPINETLFPVESNLILSPDVASWGEAITDKLISKFPALSGCIGEVVFKRTDKLEGNAVGYVTLVGRQQIIPVIIEKRSLSALDLYIDGEGYYPLNETTINKLVSKVWPFKLVSDAERQTLTKTASPADSAGLTDSFVNNHKDTLEKIAQKHPEVITQYLNAHQESYNTNDKQIVDIFIKNASCEEPITVSDLKNGAKDFSFSKFAEEYSQDLLNALIKEGHIRLSTVEATRNINLDDQLQMVKLADHRGVCYVNVGNQKYLGKMFAHKSFDNPEFKDTIFFTARTEKPYYAKYYGALQGVKIDEPGDIVIKSPNVKIGDMAFYVLDEQVYGPFLIKHIQTVNGLRSFTVETDHGIKILTQTDGIKSLIIDKKQISIPVYKGYFVVADKLDQFVKTAEVSVTVNKLTNGKLSVIDNGVSGIAPNLLKETGKSTAITALMHCGLPEKEAEYAVNKAMTSGSYSFAATSSIENNQIPSKEMNKKAEEVCAEIHKLAEESDLLKFASQYGDSENVDLALGLNIVTPISVKKYVLMIPEISAMINSLCKFLVIKRLAKSVVPGEEKEIKAAIDSLFAISQALGTL